MKRGLKITFIVIGIIILLGVLAGAGWFLKDFLESSQDSSASTRTGGTSQSGESTTSKPTTYNKATEEDFANFESILSQSPMIQDLPKSGVLLLSFYNFDSGTREWEYEYTLTKGTVEKGVPEEYDMRLIMHSKYLSALGDKTLCAVIQSAQNNGDFGTETDMSTTALLWKYKSMTDYKDCLGF